MGTIEAIVKYGGAAICVAIFYGLGFIILSGYIAWHTHRNVNENPYTKRDKVKIALLVPLVAGVFALVMWMAREYIKSGVYGENPDETFNIASFIIAAFAAYIAHNIYAARHRYTDSFFVRIDKEELAQKVERLEFENKALKLALKDAMAKDIYEEINKETSKDISNVPF